MNVPVPNKKTLRARRITEAQYITLYQEQGGVCAICKGPPDYAPGPRVKYTEEQKLLIAEMRSKNIPFATIADLVKLPRTTVHRIHYSKPRTNTAFYFIDHCHTTGKVRGLLCRACNTLIGNAKDSTAILLDAISYLQRTT